MNEERTVTVICELLRTRADNLDLLILNKQSLILYGHFHFVPKVTVQYKFY